jgi:hypothetical protein
MTQMLRSTTRRVSGESVSPRSSNGDGPYVELSPRFRSIQEPHRRFLAVRFLTRVILPFRNAFQVHGTWASDADLRLV